MGPSVDFCVWLHVLLETEKWLVVRFTGVSRDICIGLTSSTTDEAVCERFLVVFMRLG